MKQDDEPSQFNRQNIQVELVPRDSSAEILGDLDEGREGAMVFSVFLVQGDKKIGNA